MSTTPHSRDQAPNRAPGGDRTDGSASVAAGASGSAPSSQARGLRRLWQAARRPSAVYSLGGLLLVGFLGGVGFWGSFNWGLEMTNTEQFCVGCHEMNDNVFAEYQGTIHQNNHSGVRATCPDCHVPRDWSHKMVRKFQASAELYHHFMGTVDTPEKFEAERLHLASRVWRTMKKTDSRECRNCHNFDYMDFTLQAGRAGTAHQGALDAGETCIDCHQGIAHELPAGAEERYREISGGIEGSASLTSESARSTDASSVN